MIKERFRRNGPGWAEIVFSLACTALTATDVLYGRASNLPQSAESYYFEYPQVQAFHVADVVVNSLFVLAVLVWIVLQGTAKVMSVAIACLAVLGFVLCWSELLLAVNLDSGKVFHLTSLPFRPVGNSGLLGAQVYGAYAILRLPSGKLNDWQASLLKVGLGVCLWVLQLLVWDGVKAAAGLGS